MAVKKKKKVSAKASKAQSAAKRAPARKAKARKAAPRAKKAARRPAAKAVAKSAKGSTRGAAKNAARSAAAKAKPAAKKAPAKAAPAKAKSAAPKAAAPKAAAPKAAPRPRAARPAPRPELNGGDLAAEQANENAEADAAAAASGADEETADAEAEAPVRNGRLPRALRHEAEVDERRTNAGAPERAFIDPENPDDLAEELGEEYVKTVTSGESSMEETRDEVLPEESGGPFVETSHNVEFAGGTDESNPIDAEQEPFPTANQTTRK